MVVTVFRKPKRYCLPLGIEAAIQSAEQRGACPKTRVPCPTGFQLHDQPVVGWAPMLVRFGLTCLAAPLTHTFLPLSVRRCDLRKVEPSNPSRSLDLCQAHNGNCSLRRWSKERIEDMNLLDKLTVNLCTNTLHEGNCCDKAYRQKGEADLWTNTGIIAYFVPTVADHTYTGKAGDAYPTHTGQTDLSQEQWVEPKTQRGVSTAGYTVEVIDAADTEEIRVQQMVRDFGFLPSDRAIKYATSIGLDWDGFGVEVVGGDEPEAPVVAIDGLPMGVRREPRDLTDIRGWRKRRGMYRDAIPHATVKRWIV